MKVLKKISLYFIIIIIFMANVVCANTKIESKKTEAKSTWYIDTNLGQTFFTEKEYKLLIKVIMLQLQKIWDMP